MARRWSIAELVTSSSRRTTRKDRELTLPFGRPCDPDPTPHPDGSSRRSRPIHELGISTELSASTANAASLHVEIETRPKWSLELRSAGPRPVAAPADA